MRLVSVRARPHLRAGMPALLLLLACAVPASPQSASTAVVPSSINVGDVFRAAIRVEAPERAEVVFPDTLGVPEDVEAAGRREVRVDSASAGSGLLTYTAVYPLTAWRPDTVRLPGATVAVRGPAGDYSVEARFEPFVISSVLPADTTGIEPRQAKDVLGGNRVWWPLLLLALLIAALVALAIWWWRRRRARIEPAVPVPENTPRERALERIDAALASGLAESGRMKEFYSLISEAQRCYVAELDRHWSVDLTTSELVLRMRAGAGAAAASALNAQLGRADLVKFARFDPDVRTALADAHAARAWIASFDVPRRDLERAA